MIPAHRVQSRLAARAEWALLAIPVLGLLLCVRALVSATGSSPVALSLEPLHQAIESTLLGQSPAGIATAGTAYLSGPQGRIAFDTLHVACEAAALPSCARYGFLHDQVISANETAVRLAVAAAYGLVPRAGARPTPSVFVTTHDADGRPRLATASRREWYRVAAPRSPTRIPTVLTAGAHAGPALVGANATLPLNAGDAVVRVAREACAVRTGMEGATVWCGAAPAPGPGVQSTLQFETDARGWVVRSSTRGLRVNDVIADPPRASVEVGSTLYTRSTQLVGIDTVFTGVVTAGQRVNGRDRTVVHATGSLRRYARVGSALPDHGPGHGTPYRLSLDAVLTARLDSAITETLRGRDGRQIEALAVLVADATTGEVLAHAESVDPETDGALALEPALLGSVVKPPLAAAMLAATPSLATSRVRYAGPTMAAIDGVRLRRPMRNADNGCRDAVYDVVRAITCSNNQYFASLLVRSLRATGGTDAVRANGRISQEALATSAIATHLPVAFRGVGVSRGDGVRRLELPWVGDSLGGDSRVPGDLALWPYRSQVWFVPAPRLREDGTVAAGALGGDVDRVARFAIGGWDHRWSPFWLLEAYLRIATGRDIALTFRAASARLSAERVPAVRTDMAAAFALIRRGLRGVAHSGTARGLDQQVASLAGTALPVVAMAKTGTLNEDPDTPGARGTYVKTLALVVGSARRPGDTSAALRCGSGVFVLVRFKQEDERPSADALPAVHLEFTREHVLPALRESWRRLATCGAR